MSGHRQAAAALHGLTDADRDLILAALPRADQSALRLCLQEMSDLGFESGMGGADLPLGGAPVSGAGLSRLNEAQAAAMHVLLEHEPAALIGQCLAVGDWAWREGLLARFSAARREAILSAAARPPAAARARFLRATLDARLALVAALPEQRQPGFLKSLLHSVAAWTR